MCLLQGRTVTPEMAGVCNKWLKDKDELKLIADTVQKISYKIINELAESSDSAFSILQESEE